MADGDGAAPRRAGPAGRPRRAATDDTSAAPGDKAATLAAFEALTARLDELQEVLYAEHRRRVLLVLQGLDTSGKGGIVEHVIGAMHPIGVRITSFKAPTADELAHDFLWRVHENVPAAGELGVFDRSHYEDVLAVRVEGLVPKAVWRRRYAHIVGFERMLADEGTTIVKVLLHVSKAEQKRRLEARLAEPHKRWKFNPDDLRARARWDDYQTAFEDASSARAGRTRPGTSSLRTGSGTARWAVATILVATLEAMDLRWPEPPDLSGVTVD